MAAINFFSEGLDFKLPKRTAVRNWLLASMRSEGFKPQAINYIFCTDEYLYEMNVKYLKHNTLTDILTFQLSTDCDNLEGDVFISVQRVEENASKFNVPFETELCRVMIHGLLHLMGYRDKKQVEKDLMREKENYFLKRYL